MRTLIIRLLLTVNILVIVLMLATGYAGYISPPDHPYLSLIGFAFPAFACLNLAMMAVWLTIRKRWVIVPFAGFVIAYQPVRTYCPLNRAQDIPQGSLKVLSYNILGYNYEAAPREQANPILKYICDSGADIVCLQEHDLIYGQDSLRAVLKDIYPHRDTLQSYGYLKPAGDPIAIYSRYPIIHKEHIHARTKGNTFGVFVLDIDGQPVHVINAHLETVGLTIEEKTNFQDMVHGKREKEDVRRESRNIIRKLAESTAMRARQADAIAEYIAGHPDQRIILCGDLNDHPLSYVHHTIARGMTDCYAESGNLPGYSFSYHSMYVRIDNIMCSRHYRPAGCTVDKSIDLSDHYPIYTFLLPENETE